MGILRCDHPDVLEFATAKADGRTLANFNISVAATDDFMKSVESDADYALVNPRTKKAVGRAKARLVWQAIVAEAWRNGDPGLVFIDAINRANPTPAAGEIEATNPCGEVPLLPFEPCNLGSIDVSKFVAGKGFDLDRLGKTVRAAVRFLDDVIDVNRLPLHQSAEMSKANRKIGLGIMGFGDALYMQGVPYDSAEGLAAAGALMKFVSEQADKASEELAKKRGVFPNWEKSVCAGQGRRLRNAARTCVAPTGTLSMIADCSPGIEPSFALAYVKNVLEGRSLLYVNRHFEAEAKKLGVYSEQFMRRVASQGGLKAINEVPEGMKSVFVTAPEIPPEWHVRMQAAFQKHTDLAVSKTVNLPEAASMKDVEDAFMLAWKLGCKGITVYRYGSRPAQVMAFAGERWQAAGRSELNQHAASQTCPNCGAQVHAEGECFKCPRCGASYCL